MTVKDLHIGDDYESISVGTVILRDKSIYDGVDSYHFFSIAYNTHHYWMEKQLPVKLKDFELGDKNERSRGSKVTREIA